MRTAILPNLAEHFGKEVSSNLCRLGQEALELREYFSALNRPILEKMQAETLDLGESLPLPALQLKYLVKEWLEKKGYSPPRAILEGIVEALIDRERNRVFYFSGLSINVKNGLVLSSII
jgi:hypothetical protein